MDIKSDVKKQFGANAGSYVESSIHKLGKDLEKLIKIAEITGTENMLDIAAGGGHTANAFAGLVKEVTAFDLTPEMLEAAEAFIKGNGHKNVRFIQGDAENLPFEDEIFDIVACRIAPHHFPDVEAFVKETWRVLKTGGFFLLDDNVVPENDSFDHFYNHIEKKRDYSHFRAWKKSEWFSMLEKAGFEVEEFHRFTKTFKFGSWCERMQLSEQDQNELNDFIQQADAGIKKKFKVHAENGRVVSFQGEAMVLKAVKA